MDISVLLAGIIGAVLSGTGARLVDLKIQKKKEKRLDKLEKSSEFRSELQDLRSDLAKVEDELDVWKEKYYETREKFLLLKNELDQAMYVIKRLESQLWEEQHDFPSDIVE